MFLFWILLAFPQPAPAPQELWRRALESLDRSGRLVELMPPGSDSHAPAIAPGAPPLVSFRYFEGRRRHRFSELGLMMDDAGH